MSGSALKDKAKRETATQKPQMVVRYFGGLIFPYTQDAAVDFAFDDTFQQHLLLAAHD